MSTATETNANGVHAEENGKPLPPNVFRYLDRNSGKKRLVKRDGGTIVPVGKQDFRGDAIDLYAVETVEAAAVDVPILLVGTEADANALAELGFVASVVPHTGHYAEPTSLDGRDVFLLHIQDPHDIERVRQDARRIEGHPKSAVIVGLLGWSRDMPISTWLAMEPWKLSECGDLIGLVKQLAELDPTPMDADQADDDAPEPEPPSVAERVKAVVVASGMEGLYQDEALLRELAALPAAKLAAIRAFLQKDRTFRAGDFKEALKTFKPVHQNDGPVHPSAPVYRCENGCFVLETEGLRGPTVTVLSNFTARIVEEITRDNGSERATHLRIELDNRDGVDSADVPASEFEAMAWVVSQFGARAILQAGRGIRDHVRAAIQFHSRDIECRTVYTHTGWRQFEDGPKYLHAGGAIGAEGLDLSITVDLSEHGLNLFKLPPPPIGKDLHRAIRASLGVLNLGSDRHPRSREAAAIILALVYRAAITRVNFSVQFNGPTGSHKSCMAALAQQHFGAGMSYNALPSSWNSTENAIQALRHALKDSLLTIDDFVPGGSRIEREKTNKLAENVFRTQGNGQGRQRMKPDGTLRPPMDPRGSLLSTGEDRPQSASANLRTLGVWFEKEDAGKSRLGTVDKEALTRCQADADAGLYAASMAAFLRWLAPQYEAVRDSLPERVRSLRQLATRPGDHGRTPDIVAELAAGFDLFLEFAVASKAVTSKQADEYRAIVWNGLMESASEMTSDQEEKADAATVFVRLVMSALNAGDAYLVDAKTGDCPDGIEAVCGWRRTTKYQGNDVGQVPDWENAPNAKRIGHTDGELVYLDQDAAYGIAQRVFREQNETLPSLASLRRLMFDAGFLARTDPRNAKEGKGRLTDRVTLEGKQKTVLVLRASDLWGDAPAVEEAPIVEAVA